MVTSSPRLMLTWARTRTTPLGEMKNLAHVIISIR